MEKFEGKEILINVPSYQLFLTLSDLNNFKDRVPHEYKDKVVITGDTIEGELNGLKIGLKLIERVPNSKIIFKPIGGFPLDFSLIFNLNDISVSQTNFKVVLEANMNFLTKAMFGSRIQEFVDKLSDTIGTYAK